MQSPTGGGATRAPATLLTIVLVLLAPAAGWAQGIRPLSRAEAVERALGASPRGAALAADTLAAAGHLASARAYPNPTASVSYSKSTPQHHFLVDVPVDLPYVRGPRVRAARAAASSAQLTFLAARAALELDADTLYTQAQGAGLRARLSSATAADALRLLRATESRRAAGDASDLEVNLASVGAEQAANTAASDSLDALNALLELQSVLAMRSDSVHIALADSLTPPATVSMVEVSSVVAASAGAAQPLASTLGVRAAAASLASAQQSLVLQRHSVFGAPSVQVGVESGDPTGSEPGLLPTVGIALPIPLFNLNRGEIAAARADVLRAQAELDIARREAAATLARAERTRAGATARLARDSSTVSAATRNTQMTERAYTEGEMGISDVLEARRARRDAETQYVNDLVAARVSDAVIRVLTSPSVTR